MSREIAALGLYLTLLASYFALVCVAPLVWPLGAAALSPYAQVLGLATLGAGCIGITTSVMIYVVTGRPLWSLRRTAARFASTTWVLGTGVAAAVALAVGSLPVACALAFACVLGVTLKLVVERRMRSRDLDSALAALVRGARLETGELESRVRLRTRALAAGGVGLVCSAAGAALGAPIGAIAPMACACAALCVVGELGERHLFFVAEASRGMPGA